MNISAKKKTAINEFKYNHIVNLIKQQTCKKNIKKGI